MMNKMQILKKYNGLPVQVKATFWFLVCTFVQRAISVITTPIFTRIMNTAEYGEYTVFSSWKGIFSVFISLNLSLGVFVRGLVKYSDERKQFASALQSLTLMLVAAWTVIYFCFKNYFTIFTGLAPMKMLLMLLNIWLSAVFGFWAAEQRVDYKYRSLVAVTILVSVIGQLLSIIFVINFDDKVIGRILGIVIVEFAFYIPLLIKQMVNGKTFYNGIFWKYALAFNVPLIPHYLSQTVLNSSDRIMINNISGAKYAGIYGLAYSIAQVMTIFNTSLAQTLEPWLYRKIKDNKITEIRDVAYPSFVLISIVNLLLIIFAPELVGLFAPSEYYDAIWVIPPIALSTFFSFSYYFFAVFEYYYEKTRQIAIASCIGAVLNIVLNYLFIPIFGYYAAGYTTLICFMAYAVFHYLFMRKLCIEKLENKRPFEFRIYIYITIAFITSGLVMMLTYRNPGLRYSLMVIGVMVLLINYKRIISWIHVLLTIKNKDKHF